MPYKPPETNAKSTKPVMPKSSAPKYDLPAPKRASETSRKPNTFLLIGPARSGKTTQIWALPKPACAIILDPNGTEGIRGADDIDYWEFPMGGALMAPKTGKHMKEAGNDVMPMAYLNFWRFLRAAKSENLFANYASVLFDGITSLEAIATDIVLYDLNLSHHEISKEEASRLRGTIQNALRELVSIFFHAQDEGSFPQNLIVTAHQAAKVDRGGSVIGREISAYGKLRQFIPANFAHVFYTEQKGDSKSVSYLAQTHGDSKTADAGTAFRNLPYKIDLTIRDWKKPESYGLGKLISHMEKGTKWKE